MSVAEAPTTRAERLARAMPAPGAVPGVRVAGVGSQVPERVLSNQDLERMMDTSDEWIVQRTGICERRICEPTRGEGTTWLCTNALSKALDRAGMSPDELDLLIVASVTGEMTCPSTACRVTAALGAGRAAAFDLLAACSGWVYAVNVAHTMIKGGMFRNVGVIGCDALSRVVDYEDRAISILFGDAAGAAILTPSDDASLGLLASATYADGSRWKDLFIAGSVYDPPAEAKAQQLNLRTLQMNGREVYKFAVGTFGDVISETLEKAGLEADDVDMYVCHQSNARMLESARKRFGLPQDKFYVNIDRYGNCSAGSVPLCFDELVSAGRCKEGDLVMFVAFGGGLTWASSLWRL